MVIATGAAAARSIFRSTPLRQAATRLASKSKSSPSPFRLPSSTRSSHRIFRRPVELSAMLASMQPYHTATASSLLISNLTVSRCCYGWLLEDMFNGPLESLIRGM